ncbi:MULTISPECIES: integrase core domain-containing protein [unclassified Paraburkholderia]|jgi:transposase InsO family protein|uniref:integrase core domain-containing protein n=1 Tax=unclassified Paraburkholderia TaxID=2615204 RepID=UPI0038BB109B
MGTAGDAYDNAMCESFFGTLEAELLMREHFDTLDEAGRRIFSFLEGWYNVRRLKSNIGTGRRSNSKAGMRRSKRHRSAGCPPRGSVTVVTVPPPGRDNPRSNTPWRINRTLNPTANLSIQPGQRQATI